MKKKQITALLLSVFLIFGCSACAGNTNESSASSETSVSSAEPTPTEEPDVVPEDGVYTADPRLVPNARKLPQISFDEMLELASLGAQVLNNRSV